LEKEHEAKLVERDADFPEHGNALQLHLTTMPTSVEGHQAAHIAAIAAIEKAHKIQMKHEALIRMVEMGHEANRDAEFAEVSHALGKVDEELD
jgi:hypothetical protein